MSEICPFFMMGSIAGCALKRGKDSCPDNFFKNSYYWKHCFWYLKTKAKAKEAKHETTKKEPTLQK